MKTSTTTPMMLRGWTEIAAACSVSRPTVYLMADSGYFADILREDPRDGRPVVVRQDLVDHIRSMPAYKRPQK